MTQIPTSLSTPHSPLSTVHPKRKREEEEEMSESQKQFNTSQSPPSTQIQFHPTTPRKSTLNFSKPNNNHSPLSSSEQKILCRCGYGHCEVREVHSEKNRGKNYLVCPIKRGVRCFEFKWYNNEHICQSDLQPPLIKYPECQCGAGVCRKVVVNQFFSYYECPIKKSHGSCGYRVDEDELLHNARADKLVNNANTDELVNNANTDELVNNTSIVPIRQSRQRSLHEFQVDQNDITDDDLCTIDLGEGSDFLLTTKRMKIIGDSENPSPVAVPATPEGNCRVSTIEVANSQHDGFPEIEDDPELINLASWAVVEAEARFSTPSRTSCQQNLFQRDILAADASFGVFPLFDPIVVPKQTSTLNSQSEYNDLAIRSPHQCTQLSTDVVSPNRSPGSESERKAQQLQRDIAITTLQRLLNDLEGLDPHQHKSMRETAEATFLTLSLFKFECKQFSDYVWDFINLTSSMAEMENSLTLEEHNELLKVEKVRLANIQDDCMKTEALLEVSNKKKKLLCEEVLCLEDMLLEKKNELKLCELETMKVETKLDDLKRKKLEVDITLKDKALQAELAREKIVERDSKKIAARTALEKAKNALGN